VQLLKVRKSWGDYMALKKIHLEATGGKPGGIRDHC